MSCRPHSIPVDAGRRRPEISRERHDEDLLRESGGPLFDGFRADVAYGLADAGPGPKSTEPNQAAKIE
jgi:hypothetical protein